MEGRIKMEEVLSFSSDKIAIILLISALAFWITTILRFRVTRKEIPLNILNLHQPPDLKSLSNKIKELLTAGTIFIGDLNAKHPTLGSTSTNSRCKELINIIDGKGLIFHNIMIPLLIIHVAIIPKNFKIFLLPLKLLLLADGMFWKM
ncbi:hypothetical protein NPIL_160331 [Nephila pilipes]|uniref:Endonuclease/exonuclease/phosphatase domain-containing protein n=1 Tax=Nephila pilipes TaxID=299642 RepID=A0A8X6QYL7_NEPPI|nr:hypothetical protein NPIL_160331 [Nephila pilipes]